MIAVRCALSAFRLRGERKTLKVEDTPAASASDIRFGHPQGCRRGAAGVRSGGKGEQARGLVRFWFAAPCSPRMLMHTSKGS